ncbi:MAG: hypothetical protein RQ723_06540 [Desulfuromonadales bacterium]|nr:hypothetical protein [Desulfuromonadales bacterium]
MRKRITIAYYGYRLAGNDWQPAFDEAALPAFVADLSRELESAGVGVQLVNEPERALDIKGYGDLLNTIRLRSPADHVSNLCLGHVIGQSANCDLFEDMRRGVTRLAFAPETIEPEGSHKVVCHNCGCGC